jgi:hypothetical protein
MAKPHVYKLSFVEGRTAAGGNFRLPRKEWGPVVGPIHPNCTEGPLQWFQPELVDAINDAGARLAKLWDR